MFERVRCQDAALRFVGPLPAFCIGYSVDGCRLATVAPSNLPENLPPSRIVLIADEEESAGNFHHEVP